jgi:N-acetylated-alpha-linked acidic dipeptidase
MDMPIYPGDPLTPGIGSKRDAKRLALADSKTVLKIPVMPISYGDAEPLLKVLEGPVAPESWRGALPITIISDQVRRKFTSRFNQTGARKRSTT